MARFLIASSIFGALVSKTIKRMRKKVSAKTKKCKVFPRPLCYLFAICFILLGWELTALLLQTQALPTPLQTVPVFANYAQELLPDLCISTGRLFISLAIATLLALPLGLALGQSSKADSLFAPVLYMLYPLPKIVLLPILLVLLGLGGAPKIALIAITIFFQVIVVMRDASKAVSRNTIDAAKTLGAGKINIWHMVIIPSTLPQLFTTLRVSCSVAIAVLFFAEAIAGSSGIGYFIMESWAMVNYPRMFAGIIALGLLGVLVYELIDLCQHLSCRWR